MNGLIFSCLTAFAFLYHRLANSVIKRGLVREGYCAVWIGDLLFSIFGAILTLTMYRFSFLSLFTLRGLFFGTAFLLLTMLLLILAPSGLSLLSRISPSAKLQESDLGAISNPQSDIIRAEYHFNTTLGVIRNIFFLILFLFPIFLALSVSHPQYLPFLAVYTEGQLCSTFCLIAFLLLLPICLRQSIFWIRNITRIPCEAEEALIKKEKAQTYYKRRNVRI